MEIIEEEKNGAYIFRIAGRLDSKTSPEFETRVYHAIEKGFVKLIMDCETLGYISSAGLRVILKATKDLKPSRGKLILCTLQEYVKEVFEIAGFDTIIPITAGVGEALEQFGTPSGDESEKQSGKPVPDGDE